MKNLLFFSLLFSCVCFHIPESQAKWFSTAVIATAGLYSAAVAIKSEGNPQKALKIARHDKDAVVSWLITQLETCKSTPEQQCQDSIDKTVEGILQTTEGFKQAIKNFYEKNKPKN